METPALANLIEDGAVQGLKSTEAASRVAQYGSNEIPETKPHPVQTLLREFWGPIPWLLETAMVLQIGLGAYVEAGVIGGLLIFNATLGFIQEGRAGAVLVEPRYWRSDDSG